MAPTEMQSFYTPSTSARISHASPAVDNLISKCSSSMAAGNPSALYSHRRNPFQRMIDRVRLEYYRYEVTFGLYVMTPSEKCVANTFVFTVLALLLWALLLYFPSLLYNKAGSFVWLLTGQSGGEVGTAMGILDQYGNPIPPSVLASEVINS